MPARRRVPAPDRHRARRSPVVSRIAIRWDGRGCIGSISEEKRLDLAVDAVAEVPDVQLLVVGDGPLRADLEQARQVLGERVTFTGVLDDVPAPTARSMCSSSRAEPKACPEWFSKPA